ncbi:mitochondrial ornithine transporter 1-like isoform X2 [Centruroides sculpturatus]|nr:mitochondrial ornithine transporter 1-like isoform X2 [Centruroides sculpturatus]XP_023210241.1 mitochondrial ornithine transporter 1-like isoform X2 [Centruroides sculpturatus]XP_023210243.1 mitochondrial ornithine transporter 1-like isoform X2 [Centruroides sculpturatus]XP_023210244.1 mitochondrial ornithine transporter 1-like isoform X2 [Centruroides sculpturatus]XP_023210245.1 mitochondrial ornithine transporter 1-like isoform X2 [Centruroides sculpturatus]XP_023210246.1 mitochondrial o
MEQIERTQSPEINLSVTNSFHHYIVSFINLTAGAAGGTANVLVGQPLDTVKVKMQTFPHIYSNSVLCFRQTFVKEGVRGLYAGTVPALAANIAENSVLFCAYGVCQKGVQYGVQKHKIEDLNPIENATAGALAAFFSSLSLCPTELIKCKLQAMREMSLIKGATDPPIKIGPWELTRQIVKNEGIPGLFRGLTSTIFREMPGYFFFFGGYEICKTLITPKGKSKEELGPLEICFCGGIGGIALWVSIFPADVVKSRIQIEGLREPMLSVMTRIIKNEGFRTLYKGLGPTILRTFPSTGALFVSYEYTKKFLHYVTGTKEE